MAAFYYYLDPKATEDHKKFIALANSTGKTIQDFNRKCCIVFGVKLISTDPHLKSASKEMRCFGNIIDRNSDTETLAKLVMQGMGLKTMREFTLISPEELEAEEEGDSMQEYNKRKVINVIVPNNCNDDGELISA